MPDENSLQGLFERPPNEFRMMPFWFWNHEMVEEEVQRQIEEHHEHGIGGEFIHPRHGRLTPYLGRRWMENVEAAADKCKELGMPCYLYDEDNWPSGPVGGKITGPYRPENRGKFIAIFDEDEWPGGTHVEYSLDYKEIGPENEFFAAIAVPSPAAYPDFSDIAGRAVDVSKFVNQDDAFVWDAPSGEERWTVVFFCQLINHYEAGMNGYIDILRKETVEEFINETHAKYVDWFEQRGKADYLGTVIPGIFTDEPSMAHHQTLSGGMLKWFTFTPQMPGVFKEMFGYEFNDVLLSMFYETGPVSAKHRCHYWRCATEMYVDAFYKQIYEYCDAHHLATTGHVNSEGTFPSHIRNQGDFFKVFEYMHYGGCDQLTEDVRPDYFEVNANLDRNPYTGMANEMVVASKLASSAAHLLGKPRVLVEAFGTSSWDITMASAKRVNDFLVATGCDLIVPHDFAYSEDGYRKQDHPASFNHQPYYAHWKKLCDHSARLCTILNASSGTLQADILYLYPTNGFYAEMVPHDSALATTLGQYFNVNADALMRQQLDFEFANEDLILGAVQSGAKLEIGEQSFKVLFLGATTCTSLAFAKRVREFFTAGGKVFACCVLPFKDADAGESDELAGIYGEVFGTDPRGVFRSLESGGGSDFELLLNENDNGGVAVFLKAPKKHPALVNYYPNLEGAMRRLLPLGERNCAVFKSGESRDEAQSESHAAYVVKCAKKVGGDYFYFLANTSREASYEGARVVFGVPAKSLELWDTLSGKVEPFEYFGVRSGRTTLELDFPPYRSYLFRVVPSQSDELERKAPKAPANPRDPAVVQEFEPKWSTDLLGLNCAMLHENWTSSYEVEAGEAWGYKSVRTFTNSFHVSDLADIGRVKLVIEGLVGDYGWAKTTYDTLRGGDRAHFQMPPSLQFTLNGKKFTPVFRFKKEFLDPCWIVHDITDLLQEGDNVVTMTCTTRNHATYHLVTDPWRLVGRFAVEVKDGKPHLRKPDPVVSLGDLCGQGFARVHGGFGYKQGMEVPASFEGRKVTLKVDGCTDCLEVHVNGELVDVMWQSWEVDVTRHVKSGDVNNFELVYYGIAQNVLQTNLKPSGILGRVTLNAYDTDSD
ncbi:MAG: glycosyl hydrolase [Promethearchaeota archaeon]